MHNPSADSVIDSPSSQCPYLMNINNMGMAVKGLLCENKMRNLLCSRVILGVQACMQQLMLL